MGKIKSAILTVLVSVLLAVLCALCVLPSFTLSSSATGAVQDFNSVLKVMKLDPSLGGGKSTTYYPEGVIPASEYADLSESEAKDYTKHGSLYLEKSVMNGNEVDKRFQEKVLSAIDTICYRYESLDLSYLKIEVIDDYAVRVEIPSDVTSATNFFGYMALDGEFTLYNSMKSTPMLKGTALHGMDDYFKKVTTRNGVYIQFDLTKDGKEKIADITEKVAANEDDQTISFRVGDASLVSLTSSGRIEESTLYISGYTDEYIAKAVAAVIDSCINAAEIEVAFTVGEVADFEGVAGKNMPTLLYVGIGVIALALCVALAIRYRGFGAAYIYAAVSYLAVVCMCLGFIEAVTFTFGSVLAVLFGLVLMTGCIVSIFENIKKQFSTGKRISASVKEGYLSSLAGVIDIHAVLALIAVLLAFVPLGEAAAFGMALLTVTLTSAACSLLLMPVYLYLLKGMAKDEYVFCNLKREVIDDED